MDTKEQTLEEQHLSYTLEKYQEMIEETQLRFDAMPSLYRDNPDLLVEMMVNANNLIVYMKRSLEKPYFARIDFTESGTPKNAAPKNVTPKKEAFYIGKLGVSDTDDKIITVDWRAPVASLYYDSNVGEVSYEAPQGIIHGTMDLKRQYDIENRKLLSFRDVDTVSNDELLKPYLGVNADNRLKNIVASIQGEQNRIIREKLNQNLIVQGAAGSGKTTVALHRIAYLVYNYRDKIQSEQYMVIGPNQFFINYISSILPDLDVNSVPETTFEGFAADFLQEPFEVMDSSEQLIEAVQGRNQDGLAYWKGSIGYKLALDRYLEDFRHTIVPDDDFKVRGFCVLPRQEILDLYNSLEDDFYPTFQSKVNKCITTFSTAIENNSEGLLHRLSSEYQEKYSAVTQPDDIAKLHKESALIQKELSTGCRKSLRKYFSTVDTKILRLYKTFLDNIEKYDAPHAALLKEKTLPPLRKKKVFFEDLPALIYLKARIKGNADYRKYRHAVIDEAQDFGEFHFYVLRKVMEECTFTIVGDLAQSIYQYRSITDWNRVIDVSFEGNAIEVGMEKSYRTTVEIMDAANLVIQHIGMPPAIPVIRHGAPVHVQQIRPEEQIAKIAEFIAYCKTQNFQTIAIISKTAEEAQDLHTKLLDLGVETECIHSSSTQYQGGICSITGYLSKGLEFDCVILADASQTAYIPENRLDMHLLYVSMTRPLHQLEILSIGDITSPLLTLLQN